MVFVIGEGLDNVGVDATDFVDAVLEEDLEKKWDLRPLVLVLNGFAVGARLIVPSGSFGDAALCFFVAAVSIAYDLRPPEKARRRSNIEERRSSIFIAPSGAAGWRFRR